MEEIEQSKIEKLEFPKEIDKIMAWLIDLREDLEQDGIKFMRYKLNLVDKAYKESLTPTSEVIKEFLKDKIPSKEDVVEALKKVKKIRLRFPIVIKED